MTHDLEVVRGTQQRWFRCTCGWEGQPVPYGRTFAHAGREAITHAKEAAVT